MRLPWGIWRGIIGLGVIGLALSVAMACAHRQSGQDASADAPGMQPAAIEAHTAFLASDLLEGREAGTRGYDLAAAYVAAQFAAIGLAPGGDDGTYFQSVPLQIRKLVPGSVRFTMTTPNGSRQFVNGGDVAIDASALETEQDVTADVVFAGFGIVAPELGHDDYAGLDVKDKLVAVFGSAPASFPSTRRAHYGLGAHKAQMAAERGAVGMLMLKTPSLEKVSSWDYTRRQLLLPRMTWVGEDGVPYVRAPGIRVTASLGVTAAEELFARAPKDIHALREEAETGAPKGFPLDATVRITRRSAHEIVRSPNVIGVLRGSDPELADEYVVVTSHLDHVGIGIPIGGDRIYNGAVDNAVGIAMVVEIARALAADRTAPRRSVVFVATTAEEKGLLGSLYFASHPTVPLDRIVANINIDGMDGFYDFGDVIAYGSEHSTLGQVMQAVLRGTGVELTPDPNPELLIFARSDQYALVEKGVPALFVLTGPGPGRDGRSGADVSEWYTRNHYHRPSDDMSLPWNWPAVTLFAEIHRRLIHEVATSAERPRWYEGDFFGETFAAGADKAPRAGASSS